MLTLKQFFGSTMIQRRIGVPDVDKDDCCGLGTRVEVYLRFVLVITLYEAGHGGAEKRLDLALGDAVGHLAQQQQGRRVVVDLFLLFIEQFGCGVLEKERKQNYDMQL